MSLLLSAEPVLDETLFRSRRVCPSGDQLNTGWEGADQDVHGADPAEARDGGV